MQRHIVDREQRRVRCLHAVPCAMRPPRFGLDNGRMLSRASRWCIVDQENRAMSCAGTTGRFDARCLTAIVAMAAWFASPAGRWRSQYGARRQAIGVAYMQYMVMQD